MLTQLFILCTFYCSTFGIQRGHDANITDFPWQVAIFHINTLKCGGALISDEWILTSARCLSTVDDKSLIPSSELYIVLGTTDVTQGITYGVRKTVIHEDWDKEQLNDLGLIKTGEKVKEDHAQPVTLPEVSYQLQVGDFITISGWGKTGYNNDYPNILQAFTISVKENDLCALAYLNDNIINDRMFCAGLDTCAGDLGGPAVDEDGVLVGIIAMATECLVTATPGIFTRVASFGVWIIYNMAAYGTI